MAAMVSEEVQSSTLTLLSDRQLIQDQFELSVTAVRWQGRLTASAVGQIVGLQSEEIKQIASEYAEKVSAGFRARLHGDLSPQSHPAFPSDASGD